MSTAECLVADPAGDEFTFEAQHAVGRLPPGTYRGKRCPKQHLLGSNGAGTHWVFVSIVAAPGGAESYVGSRVNIRLRRPKPSVDR